MIKTYDRINGQEVYGRELNDLSEAIGIMEAVRDRGLTDLTESSLNHDGSAKPWSGTATIEEAIDIARHGWSDGNALIYELLEKTNIDTLVGSFARPEYHSAVAGDEVDVDRYLSGEHENMMQPDIRHDQNGKVVDLFVNCSVASNVSPRKIMRRGAGILLAKEILTSNGYSMGVTMVECSTSSVESDTVVEYRVPLVAAGDYLDLDTAVFCMAHPSFLRRLMFALNDNEPNDLRREMGYWKRGEYGIPRKIMLPLPKTSIVIDRNEGLAINGVEEIAAYAGKIVKRAHMKLEDDIE